MHDSFSSRSILLIEPHAGLAGRIQDQLWSRPGSALDLGIARSMREAMNHLSTHQVEVVLMNLTLPDYKGLDAIRAIRLTMPACALVVFSTVVQDMRDLDAIRAGAHEFLSLSTLSPETLHTTIARALARSEASASPSLSSAGSLPSAVPARTVHDLNNAVTAINGFADMLLTRLPSEDQARASIEQIRKAGSRASLLIRSFSSVPSSPCVPVLYSDATNQAA